MKNKYSTELEGKEILNSYSNAKKVILQQFSDISTHDYLFFKILGTDSIDVGLLKKHLEDTDLTTDAE